MLRDYDEDLVPQCELCWIQENSVWEPDSVDERGNIITRLVNVSVPLNLSPGAVCECITCGKVTVVGIYVPIESIEERMDNEEMEVEDINPPEEK
jgi:hypothetical protein